MNVEKEPYIYYIYIIQCLI